jgi:phosphoacetylglucosamine mutase
MGIFSALRSASLGGEEVGVMITASHNPEEDNGMKLADSNGGMLDAAWEEHAVSLANAPNSKEAMVLISTLTRYIKGKYPQKNGGLPKMVVHVGRDTRSHSPGLAKLVVRAALAMGATVIDHGEVSTPMLHHFVMHANGHLLPGIIPQRCNESGYYEIMAFSYAALLRTGKLDGVGGKRLANTKELVIDGACGIGALKIDTFRKIFGKLSAEGCVGLPMLRTVNFPGEGPLNENCGAEYVQKLQLPPNLYSPKDKLMGMSKGYMTSFDGDADRVVFHFEDVNGKFHLLDGDKIAVLVSSFIQEELRCIDPDGQAVKCGVVQTAYANGSSTLYLKNVVKTNVVVAKTGVKFVHAAAHHHFDVGVYFEANGHGTVLFGPKFYDFIAQADAKLRGTPRNNRANIALRRLRLLPALVNQSVGDAMSDMLLVDAILYLRGWDLNTWAQLYSDMPSKQAKVKVADRTVIATNDNETAATAPEALQKALQSAMDAMAAAENRSDGPKPRCFVRPSGTEDAVRVYAEANTQNGADSLASEAMMLIYKLCGGVGSPPQPFITNRL